MKITGTRRRPRRVEQLPGRADRRVRVARERRLRIREALDEVDDDDRRALARPLAATEAAGVVDVARAHRDCHSASPSNALTSSKLVKRSARAAVVLSRRTAWQSSSYAFAKSQVWVLGKMTSL